MYEEYKIYGPYLREKDNRLFLILYDKNKNKRTLSYPKYIVEMSIKKYLEKDELVHHVDENPLNNELSNLRIVKRKTHTSNHNLKKYKLKEYTCHECGKMFLEGKEYQRNKKYNIKNNRALNDFCSKACSGKYSQKIQMSARIPTGSRKKT